MNAVTNPFPPGKTAGGTATAERPAEVSAGVVEWSCIVWDDPVNLMSYVTHVFTTHFGYSRQRAEKLMLEVHTEGRSAVASGSRESMEGHVNAMHGYGLWATLEPGE